MIGEALATVADLTPAPDDDEVIGVPDEPATEPDNDEDAALAETVGIE